MVVKAIPDGYGTVTPYITVEKPGEVMDFLKNDPSTRYDFLADVTAVDYLGYPVAQSGRFAVVYVLRSYEKDELFIVKTYLDPSLPTDGIAEDPARSPSASMAIS